MTRVDAQDPAPGSVARHTGEPDPAEQSLTNTPYRVNRVITAISDTLLRNPPWNGGQMRFEPRRKAAALLGVAIVLGFGATATNAAPASTRTGGSEAARAPLPHHAAPATGDGLRAARSARIAAADRPEANERRGQRDGHRRGRQGYVSPDEVRQLNRAQREQLAAALSTCRPGTYDRVKTAYEVQGAGEKRIKALVKARCGKNWRAIWGTVRCIIWPKKCKKDGRCTILCDRSPLAAPGGARAGTDRSRPAAEVHPGDGQPREMPAGATAAFR